MLYLIEKRSLTVREAMEVPPQQVTPVEMLGVQPIIKTPLLKTSFKGSDAIFQMNGDK